MPIEVKSFTTQADEAKDMPNARMEAVNVLGKRIMKLYGSDCVEFRFFHIILAATHTGSFILNDHKYRQISINGDL